MVCRDSWHGRVAQPCGFVSGLIGAVRLLFQGSWLGSRYVGGGKFEYGIACRESGVALGCCLVTLRFGRLL